MIDKSYIEKTNSLISHYILPLGLLFFLSGLLFLNSISAYHTQIYLFLIAPALFFVLTRHHCLAPLLSSKAFQVLVILLVYTMLSLLWNDAEVDDFKYIKRLIIILLFVLSLFIINTQTPDRMITILLISACIYTCAAYYSFAAYYGFFNDFIVQNKGENGRIIGIGNLSNPLLSSHLYGTFTAFIMAYFFALKRNWKQDTVLIFLFISLLFFILLTQSRTPLLGLSVVFLLLLWMHRSKNILYLFVILCTLSIIYLGLNFDQLMQRGLSFRPEIWSNNIEHIKNNPVFGIGLGSTTISTYIKDLDMLFTEPHNIHLGVTYNLGILGLLLWIILLISLFSLYLRNKTSLTAQIGIVLLAYGMAAGMTEGGSFFSRPKEVWFLTWLPIALLLAAENHSLSIDNKT